MDTPSEERLWVKELKAGQIDLSEEAWEQVGEDLRAAEEAGRQRARRERGRRYAQGAPA